MNNNLSSVEKGAQFETQVFKELRAMNICVTRTR